MGQAVRRYCNKLDGVDLSKEMLHKANRKGIYDSLIHADIIDYLNSQIINYNCFFATDVFIYIGDVKEVFQALKEKNKGPGKLFFSTEHREAKGFNLESSGRYSHSKDYIEKLCEALSFNITMYKKVPLRKDKEGYLEGALYALEF